jgi:hypothetical protein
MPGARREQELRRGRRARGLGIAGLVAAAGLPVVLWRDVIAMVAQESELGMGYLTGWMPWVLMALGLLCFAYVLVLDAVNSRSRFHRPGGGAWMGWGVSLYLLGFALATQVAQIANGFSSA